MKVLALFLAVLVFATLYSVAIIASLNYLFHFDIGYTVLSILSVLCLGSVFGLRMSVKGDK